MSRRIHLREPRVIKAEAALRVQLEEWLKANEELTSWETLRALQSVFSSQIASLTRIEIRIERHGDPDREGGLA